MGLLRCLVVYDVNFSQYKSPLDGYVCTGYLSYFLIKNKDLVSSSSVCCAGFKGKLST